MGSVVSFSQIQEWLLPTANDLKDQFYAKRVLIYYFVAIGFLSSSTLFQVFHHYFWNTYPFGPSLHWATTSAFVFVLSLFLIRKHLTLAANIPIAFLLLWEFLSSLEYGGLKFFHLRAMHVVQLAVILKGNSFTAKFVFVFANKNSRTAYL
jgi:hypothetical protein